MENYGFRIKTFTKKRSKKSVIEKQKCVICGKTRATGLKQSINMNPAYFRSSVSPISADLMVDLENFTDICNFHSFTSFCFSCQNFFRSSVSDVAVEKIKLIYVPRKCRGLTGVWEPRTSNPIYNATCKTLRQNADLSKNIMNFMTRGWTSIFRKILSFLENVGFYDH